MLVFVSLPRFFLFLYPLSSVYLLLGSASYVSQLPHLHYLPRAVPLTQDSSLADKEGRLEPNPSPTVEIEQPNADLSSATTQIPNAVTPFRHSAMSLGRIFSVQ